ncbi:MAG TPA: twin-arginine translocation signal domain-containing protein [Blastocatellia bacterium]|nr:twin-arginine translocation signal domain-containing protein [Blastocatellia bacterium]
MSKTTRRSLLKGATASSVAVGLSLTAKPNAATAGIDTDKEHQHTPVNGPMANATVSFGQWSTDPPLDRFPNLGAPAKPNGHQLIPHEVTIKAGGTVNFIIAGFHHILVYDDGTQPTDINADLLVPGSTPPGLIDDPNNRIYRGLDPRAFPQDRVEVVQFPKRGRYLVICGVRPHFVNDEMYGWVRVLP